MEYNPCSSILQRGIAPWIFVGSIGVFMYLYGAAEEKKLGM